MGISKKASWAILAVGLAGALPAAASTVTITLTESDGNTILTGTGTFDLAGFQDAGSYTHPSHFPDIKYVNPDNEAFEAYPSGVPVDLYNAANYNNADETGVGTAMFQGYQTFAAFTDNVDDSIVFDSHTGSNFSMAGGSGRVVMPSGYNSDEQLDFTLTLNGETGVFNEFETATLFTIKNEGTTTNTWTFVDGRESSAAESSDPAVSAVPLPASILFLGAGMGGLGLMARRRKKAA